MALLSTKTIQVDFQSPGAPQIVHVVQEDSLSRQIAFQIFSGGAQWDVPDGTLVTIRYSKPDGTVGYYDTLPDGSSAYSTAENVVTVTLAPQMLTVSGDVQVQLNLYDGTGTSLATFSIIVEVAQNIVPSEVVESSDYFNLLTQQVATAVSSAAEAKTSAENAAASAEQSAQSATQSASSAQAAAQSAADAQSAASTAAQDAAQSFTQEIGNPINIQYGGTGASTPETALENLGGLPIAGGTMTGPLTLNAGMTPQNLGSFSDMNTAGWNAIQSWYNALSGVSVGYAVINNTSGSPSHGLANGTQFLTAYKASNRYGSIVANYNYPPCILVATINEGSFSDFSTSNISGGGT